MALYRLLRPLLFTLSADRAHSVTLAALRCMPQWLCRLMLRCAPEQPTEVFGLRFRSPVGLAAGFDKDGVAIDALFALGFGFVEVGAVTPKAQPGNPRPHVRRFTCSKNIVNACGFNNSGVDKLVTRLKARRLPGVVGVNLGRNKTTPNERAVNDYLYCMRQVYSHCDFVTINISSPNTAGLRDLHQAEQLNALLQPLVAERDHLQQQFNKRLPMLVKLSPDLDDEAIEQVVSCCLAHGIDGVIATNTSLQHDLIPSIAAQKLPGGLSGPAIAALSRHVLEKVHVLSEGKLPIISVGGIDSPLEAQWRLQHGASLVQLYTGLVYQGARLIKLILRAIKN